MKVLHKKNKVTFSKGWISIAKIAENTRRGKISPTCSHLYNYANNNPVRYIDPDGRDIVYQDNDGNEVWREKSEKNEIHTPASDLAMMNKNTQEMADNKLNIIMFAKNVKTGGKWDFKDKNNPEHRSYYWFNNELVSAEEFGNIHYGYVGAAGGFGKNLLIDAPGIVQVNQNTAKLSFIFTNFDDPRDTANILKGYNAYNMSISSGLCNFVAANLYTRTHTQFYFKIITFDFFVGKSIYNFFMGGKK